MWYPTVGVTFALGYFSHILLDALDSADFWPLWPLTKINIRGPVPYFSIEELVLTIGLLVAYIAS
jgi:membrane-bound metal-dependent hydrolase YbcI (DUF457 family)